MTTTFDPSFLDAIERLVIHNWEGFVWRVTVGDTPVMRTNTYGARWNPPDVEALYTSLDKEAALAELNYLLSKQPIPVLAVRKVTRIHARLERVVNLSTEENVRAIGYQQEDFLRESITITQHVGGAIAWLGIPGLLTRSARYGANNLVMFRLNLSPTDVFDPLETQEVP